MEKLLRKLSAILRKLQGSLRKSPETSGTLVLYPVKLYPVGRTKVFLCLLRRCWVPVGKISWGREVLPLAKEV